MLVEVEHVKAHRSKKETQHMSLFEKVLTEGNEKADELAREGAMLDGGGVAESRASTVQQRRNEVYAALQYAAGFHCLVKEWKDCEDLKPKTKEKCTLCGQKAGSKEASCGVVCSSEQISVHEMRKKQQQGKIARTM